VKVFVCTADTSGDQHAAALVHALRARLRSRGESLEAFGLGGTELVAAGLEPVVKQSELAVAGLVEVLSSAPRVVSAYFALRRALRERKPDIAVLVDSPDLNLPLAAVARRAGLRALYYVAPQVWAWRFGRVRKLKRRVDHVGVIFPFEEPLLRGAQVPATFVGHPLVERMAALRRSAKPDVLARELGADTGRPLLGLLPGSRHNELERNLPMMLESAELARRIVPDLQVWLLLAPAFDARALAVPEWIRIVQGRTHEAMLLATALLAAPGTVTVEAALLGVPFVVAHRVNPLSFEIARRISRVPSSCMVNLIAGRGVVSEYLQESARPPVLAAAVARLIRSPERAAALSAALSEVTAKLGGSGASERAAELVLEVAGAR
jgi:lipid-A-disaccharide synthase